MKSYLKYELLVSFGVIASNADVLLYEGGRLAITAALESIAIWDLRKGMLVRKLTAPLSASGRPAAEITRLALAPGATQLAAGHADGSVRLWALDRGECDVTLAGHKSGVSALRYGRDGALLASGGQDTDVVVWDTAAEVGLFRLRGHSDQVTDVAFVEQTRSLVSCSKDTHVRVWDLEGQHCYQTLVLNVEVWSLDVNPEGSRLVVGGRDKNIYIYAVQADSAAAKLGTERELLKDMGTMPRAASGDHVALLRYEPSGQLLVCQTAGKALEVLRVRSQAEARRHVSRRRKRKRDKAERRGEGLEGGGPPGVSPPSETLTATDELTPFQVVHAKHKLRGFAFGPEPYRQGKLLQVTWALANNSLEVWNLPELKAPSLGGETPAEPARAATLELPGHRAAVRAVALSSDDALAAAVGGTSVKLWNPRTGACVRTVPTGNGLCVVFAPGNRHVVVGTDAGRLQLVDLGASSVCADVAAHEKKVLALAALPDKSGLVTGSDDGTVKLWEWEVVSSGEGPRQLGFRLARTLRLSQEVLAVKPSPDGRLLAVALLDNTIQVFFLDSLKLFLSLYGHKLPALSMDISSDSTLLVSGGADKNIRIWGLDFGDCHRSIFAHGSHVTQVAFVPNTHYCFTAGKDRLVKYWDADRWAEVATLEGHAGEVWALAVSSGGELLVSASADRGLRVWERTDETLFLEEEAERRLESLFESEMEDAGRGQTGRDAADEPSAAPAGRKTLEAIGAADSIADALDLAAHEFQRRKEHEASGNRKPLDPNPVLLEREPEGHVLQTLGATPAADLEQALLLLPFTDALRLLSFLCTWLRRGQQVELCCRVAALLVRLHNAQLLATPTARPALSDLATLLRTRTRQLRDVLGFNLAALGHLADTLKERQLAFQ